MRLEAHQLKHGWSIYISENGLQDMFFWWIDWICEDINVDKNDFINIVVKHNGSIHTASDIFTMQLSVFSTESDCQEAIEELNSLIVLNKLR